MATLQSAQQPMAYPPSQMSLPPNMTPEVAKQTYDKYKRMAQDGIPESDPEMVKARYMLTHWQQQSKQQQRVKAMQQQQQQMQHVQNGNGLHHAQEINGTMSHSQAFGSVNGHPSSNASIDGNLDSNHQSEGNTQGYFSDEQRLLLRNQITAFKMLFKNAPIPFDVQRQVFPSLQSKKSPTPLKLIQDAENVVDQATEVNGLILKAGVARGGTFEYSIDPRSHRIAMPPAINYAQHADRSARPFFSALLGEGVDVEKIRAERENIIYNRTVHRLKELENLHPGIESWDTSKFDSPQGDGVWKRKAYIEYKQLLLLPKQRALRERIAQDLVQNNSLAMTVNRSSYRRPKKQSDREARNTEKLEKDQRNAREQKEKNKHKQYLNSIFAHAEEVHRAAKEQKARVQRLGRQMIQQHQIIEKEEQRRVERTARQRLQALKANDEETYLKLLGQAKDSRISHLLKQTDGFLNQLAASVKDQQRSSVNAWGGPPAVEESESEPEEIEDEDDPTGKKVDYYEVAHKIKEVVTAQSSNLVGGTLKEYQVKGLQWMISLYNNNLNGILADEMGLGKTIQTISLITYLIEAKKQHGPFLVIVPLSTLTNWNSEFEKWAPSVNRIVYKGPPNQRKQAASQIKSGFFQVLLTTYEFIIKDRPILSKVKWLHMIVDEGHRMKNAQSKLSSTITNYYQTRFRLILTGTPLQNNLPELWALLNFVLPTIFKSVKSFDEWFNTPFANTGGQDSMTLTEEEQLLVIRRLHKVLRPFLLRRLKKDVEKDLPDKQERVIKCNFSSLQAKLYKSLMTHQRLMVNDGKGGKTGMRGLSNMLMQLRKLCNHPFVFDEVEDAVNPQRITNDLLWRTAGKFELLDRILPKFLRTGHRVLMFFQMTQIMNIMEDFMRWRGFQYLRLDGSTKSDERADLLKEFNAENSPYFCFLLSTRAGGLGLNLQTADTVIIFDSDWNPHQDLQAQDRAHRIGQKHEVRILRLISSNSVEEKILERANFKLDMDGKVIQAGKFDNKSTNEERDAMLRVMLESAEAAENLETEEMDDDDLNVIMMRSDDELITFQKMDEERANDPIYGTGKQLPRLFSDVELPEIYLNDDAPVEEQIEEITGRGARERTRVRYDDGLTEEQWADAVDNEEDSIEAAIERKQSRIAKRHAKRGGDGSEAGSPLPATRESSESPAPAAKKRNRKGTTKRKADEVSVDSEPLSKTTSITQPPKKRNRKSQIQEILTPNERQAIQNVLNTVFERLNDIKQDADEFFDHGRDVVDLFTVLPERNLYPDYYVLITNPICMEDMSAKINFKHYQTLNQFWDDIKLMGTNCRTYNEEGSWLVKDATTIENAALANLKIESAATPALGKAAFREEGALNAAATVPGTQTPEDGTALNGRSTASGVGSPADAATANGMAAGAVNGSGTGMKLKLNLTSAKKVGTTGDHDVEMDG